MQDITLQLAPQSGRNLAPNQQNGITQLIRVQGVAPGKGVSVKMRWKVTYKHGSTDKEDAGMIDGLQVG